MRSDTQNVSFEEKIVRLISREQEGSYWDFKKEWHKSKTDLLHDIICMANNLSNRDAYIIIGVDEENNYRIASVENDSNRKNTQRIVDFLKDKKFAGGVRPIVYVETIKLSEGTIDVVVIENSHNTPFYLTDQFEGVKANSIYTRVMDTNTPIDKSADINNVEYLWRKRFRLDDIPLEIIELYINDAHDWENSPIEFEMCKYYKKSPEYIIKEEPDDTRTGYEFYLFGQTDSTPHWHLVTLYYHQTALAQFQGIALDGGRCFVIVPDMSGISFSEYGHWDVSYRYYAINTLRYKLQCFYRQDGGSEYEYALGRFMECVLLFDSEFERKQFEMYVKQNESHYRELCSAQGDTGLPYFPILEGYNMDGFRENYRNALVMQKMLEDFRIKI